MVRVNRILQPDNGAAARDGGQAHVAAAWRLPDGTQIRGIFASAQWHKARMTC